jgi:xylulokinase
VFALDAGIDILRETGFSLRSVRAGRANLFLSPLFRRIFATVTGIPLELYDTDGSAGAARGAGLGAGIFGSLEEALTGLVRLETVEPDGEEAEALREARARWRVCLERTLS